MTRELAEARELLDMARSEQDSAMAEAVSGDVARLEKEVDALEFQRMFSGEMDEHNAFVDIKSGDRKSVV